MYCLRWWIALFLLPFPSAPPAFLILFLISYAYATKPCVYCSGILIALFTSSCYWYSGSPTPEEYYGINPADPSSMDSTAARGKEAVDQARRHLADLHAAQLTASSISTESLIKAGIDPATAQELEFLAENQDAPTIPLAPPQSSLSQTSISSPSESNDKLEYYRPNWCWLDLRGTGTGTGWWEPLQRPGYESRRSAVAAMETREGNHSADLHHSRSRNRLWHFFFTPTVRLLSFFPLLETLFHSLPRLPPKVFIGIPNSGIGIYLNLSLGF